MSDVTRFIEALEGMDRVESRIIVKQKLYEVKAYWVGEELIRFDLKEINKND